MCFTQFCILHTVMVNLGTQSGKVIIKVARRAHTGRTQGKHSPKLPQLTSIGVSNTRGIEGV